MTAVDPGPAAAHAEHRRRSPVRTGCAHAHSCSPEHRRMVLGRSPLFASLSPAQLDAVNALVSTRSWEAGEHLHVQGEPERALHLIATGSVLLETTMPDGRTAGTELLGSGGLVGSLAGAVGADRGGEEAVQPDSARALTTVCAVVIDDEVLARVVRSAPGVAMAMLEDFGSRLAGARTRAVTRSTGGVPQRAARVLLELAEQAGEEQEDGSVLVQVPLSREDLAGLAATTTESVSRVMSQWKRDGLVSSGRRWIAIRDTATLERIATGE